MRCEHVAIQRAVRGQQAECSRCGIPIIHDGKRWLWQNSLSQREVNSLTSEFNVNRIIGKP